MDASNIRSGTGLNLLTLAEAAVVAHCHADTLRRAIRADELPAFRLGRRGDFRIDLADLETWLAVPVVRATRSTAGLIHSDPRPLGADR